MLRVSESREGKPHAAEKTVASVTRPMDTLGRTKEKPCVCSLLYAACNIYAFFVIQ